MGRNVGELREILGVESPVPLLLGPLAVSHCEEALSCLRVAEPVKNRDII